MSREIEIDWVVRESHSTTLSWAQWRRFCEAIGARDHNDVDAVYDLMDDMDWKVEEALYWMTHDGTWIDHLDAEVIDVRDVDS